MKIAGIVPHHQVGAQRIDWTGAFKGAPEAHSISFYAATRRYRLLTRGELLPQEADHPRAADYYYRIELGPFQRLEHPLPAATLRRATSCLWWAPRRLPGPLRCRLQ